MSDGKTVGSSAVVKTADTAATLAALPLTAETVIRYVNALATPGEVALFLNQCAMFGLNPWKREIYLIKYSPKDPATFVVGYETYLKRAERTTMNIIKPTGDIVQVSKWCGMESGTTDDENGHVKTAWVKVYRRDWDNPLFHEVYFDEYVQTKAEWIDGKPTGKQIPTKFWATKPRTMLKKVAVAQAFRMAFPDEMGGMPYTAEEMPVDHAKLPTGEITIDPGSSAGPGGMTATEYEQSKMKPLPRIKDEFDPGDDAPAPAATLPSDTEPEAAEPNAGPGTPSLPNLERFAKLKSRLIAAGIPDQTIWDGIETFSKKTLGRPIVDQSMSDTEMEMVLGYMNRWEKALEKENAAREKANGKR